MQKRAEQVRNMTPGLGETGDDYREVYFVRAVGVGLIKIGIAICARRRLRNLEIGSPVPLEIMGVLPVDKAHALIERILHARFRHLRSHGEWFRPGDDLLAYIAENAAPPRNGPTKRPSLLERRLKNAARRRRAAEEIAA